MNVLYYALGGGHGHVLRGLAVLRALAGGTLVAPRRLAAWARSLGVACVSPPVEQSAAVAAWLAQLPAPELLLVDVFPLGAGQELHEMLGRSRAWLVARWVRPRFYLDDGMRRAIETRYERILWCEGVDARLRGLRVAQSTVQPALLAGRMHSRPAARAALGVGPRERLILGLGSGPREQQQRLCRLLAKVARRVEAEWRFVSTELPARGRLVDPFPASRWLRAADVIVSAAGYHAYHETQLSGVPTLYVPQKRRLDDQHWRARQDRTARSPEELEDGVRMALDGGVRPRGAWPRGAHEIADLVRAAIDVQGLGEVEGRDGATHAGP